ncbi:MAG: hypothetical protein EXR74_07755 [Bdellovibrionales bacterium]|nr:hypothetical protein [Bdellovibrionales bacterium]
MGWFFRWRLVLRQKLFWLLHCTVLSLRIGGDVRDTVVVFLMLLGGIGVYFTAKQFQENNKVLSTSSKPVSHASHSRKKILGKKTSQNNVQGENNESTDNRSRDQVESASESIGSEAGASSSFEEIEGLSSIYQSEEPELSRQSVTSEAQNNSEVSENVVEKEKPSFVYGVPVVAWLKHHKNRLPSKVDPTDVSGMRVFFNCIEFKKQGAKSLTQGECKEIAISREKSRGAALMR